MDSTPLNLNHKSIETINQAYKDQPNTQKLDQEIIAESKDTA